MCYKMSEMAHVSYELVSITITLLFCYYVFVFLYCNYILLCYLLAYCVIVLLYFIDMNNCYLLYLLWRKNTRYLMLFIFLHYL